MNDASFVVVWESKYQDGGGYGIYAQHFDASGNKIGAEIQVNTYTDDDQGKASVAALSDGGFIVVWQSGKWDNDTNFWDAYQGQDGSGSGVYAQRFDASDNLVGSEVQINTYTQDSQGYQRVAGLPDGGYVITWISENQVSGDSGWDVYAQQFDASDGVVVQEFLVNTHTSSHQSRPDIAAMNDGGYVVTWRSKYQDGDGYGVYAQRYDENGTRINNDFLVNTHTINSQSDPSISSLDDGGFIITWESYNQLGSDSNYGYEIYAQRYDSNSLKVNDEFIVNTHTQYNQANPSVASLSDGGFFITWESSSQDTNDYGVYAQRYDVNSIKYGAETPVNTVTAGAQDSPVAIALSDRGVIVWTSNDQDGSGSGVFAQLYDEFSQPINVVNNVYDAIVDSVAFEDQVYALDTSIYYQQQNPGASFTYSATLVNGSDLPIWLSIDSATGILSGTPENDDTGLLNITVVVTDSLTANELYDTFYLTVNNVNDVPTFTGDFSGDMVVGNASITGLLTGDDVDEYFDIRDATNWTDYDVSTGNSGESIYTRTNTNGDTRISTSLDNIDGSKLETFIFTLSTGEWSNQTKTTAVNGDYTRHYTDSIGVDYLGSYTHYLDGSRDVAFSGDMLLNGVLYYNDAGLRVENSLGVATSYSGTTNTLDGAGRQVIASMDGTFDNGYPKKIFTMSTDLGIDWVNKDGLSYAISNQQGTYGSLKLDEQANWIYTLDNTDPDTTALALGVSDNDSFNIVLSDGNDIITQAIDINVVNPNNINATTISLDHQGISGIDHITTLGGSNTISALAGNDTINLSANSTWSSGYAALNVSNDASVGTNQKIDLAGLNRFSDVIDGGADVDTLNLTDGNDAFFIDDVYSAHHSSLTLSSTTQGIDSTARTVNLEVINAGEGNDIVDLTSDNYVLANAIEINGEAGDDILWGSNGNDTIDGGTGGDTLTGGAGADIFQFTATAGSDVITDFDYDVSGGVDAIQLYYRTEDNHTNSNLTLANGILTWDVDATNNDVVIDLSATVTSGDTLDDLSIVFVEIV